MSQSKHCLSSRHRIFFLENTRISENQTEMLSLILEGKQAFTRAKKNIFHECVSINAKLVGGN
jgi:hypothetical protein